jgi:enamine deaminase RidA (YjgF/YER057c/UK114 family)
VRPISEAGRPQPADTADHPYSPAFEAGNFVFVSGALSVDTAGRAVAGTRPALRAAMERLRDRLATSGLGLEDVVKATYFVTDVAVRRQANEQFLETFAPPRPARTFVEVSRLPYSASVEIDAVAYRRPRETDTARQR